MPAPSRLAWSAVLLWPGLVVAATSARAAPAPVFRKPPAATDDARIEWTDTLKRANYDAPRDRFGKNYGRAMRTTKLGRRTDATSLKDLEMDLRTLELILFEEADQLTPSEYIDSRRFLKKLKVAVKSLSTGP